VSSRVPTLAAAVFAVLAISSPLAAQEPFSAPPGVVATSPATDSVYPFQAPIGAPMRTGVTTYRLSLIRDAGPISLGVRTVEVTESQLGGIATWLIAERRTGSAVATTDSLWLTRAELTPVRWAGTIDRTQLAASFSHDSIFGAFQNYAGRQSFAAPMLPGVLVTPGMTERILELLPLRAGYHAAASLLLVDMGMPRALPAEIVVEREERIRTPSGDADCWVVVVRASSMEERLWVDKGRKLVVRREQPTSSGKVVSEL
jgi:hypothetical protein